MFTFQGHLLDMGKLTSYMVCLSEKPLVLTLKDGILVQIKPWGLYVRLYVTIDHSVPFEI